MKKKHLKILALFVFMGVAVTSCYKNDPSYYEDYDLTITYFDKTFDFSSVSTFYMRDSVGFISDEYSQGDPEWKKFYSPGGASDQIRSQILTNFTERGYKQVDSLKEADFVLNPFITVTTTSYTYYPGYWYGYPGYWYCYWPWCWYKKGGAKYYYDYPGWGYGYYPWYGSGGYVEYTSHNLMIEMADGDSLREIYNWHLQNPNGDWSDAPKMRYYWQAYIGGILSGDNSYDLNRIKDGINEAFEQSAYLKK